MGKIVLANRNAGVFVFRGNYLIIQVGVKINNLHRWDVSLAKAREIQLKLASKVVITDKDINPQLVAGVDISSPDSHGMARGAVVVLGYPELNIVEVKVTKSKVTLPYIPGLLSFRECPVILAVCEMLYNTPDIVLVDGQGIAHPRKLGLASHLGLFLDIPTIGCAKSILCGKHELVGEEAGSFAGLINSGEIVGAALRTKVKVKPIYVSVGHKVNLTMALNWVMKCCRGYRLPEPTRLAHLAAAGKLSSEPK